MKLTIISDKGTPMMVVTKIKRKGSSLEITGQMMGAWPSKMYITPKEFLACIRFALTPGVIMYLLAYPLIIIRSIFKKKK